jgi:hypothetical protein
MRKFDLSKKLSLENTAVVVEQPIVAEPAPVVDEVPSQVDLPETDASANEVAEYSSGLDTLLVTTDALESLVASMESSLVTGGLNRQAYGFAQMHAQHLTASIGLDTTIPSMESAGSRLAATEIALESVKDAVLNAGKAVLDFIRKLFSKIADFLKSSYAKTTNVLKKLAESLKNVTEEMLDKKVQSSASMESAHTDDTLVALRLEAFMFLGKYSTDIAKDVESTIENAKLVQDLLEGSDFLNLRAKIFDTTKKIDDEDTDLNTGLDQMRPVIKEIYELVKHQLKLTSAGHMPFWIGSEPVTLKFSPEESVGRQLIWDKPDSLNSTANSRKSTVVTLRQLGLTVEKALKLSDVCEKAKEDFIEKSRRTAKQISGSDDVLEKLAENSNSPEVCMKVLSKSFNEYTTVSRYCFSLTNQHSAVLTGMFGLLYSL